MSAAAETPPPSLEARIHGLLPVLSPAQTRIAAEVLRDPAAVAGSTIGQLAVRCGTSLPSVTRFCIALGLSGYAELRLTLAAESGRNSPGWVRGSGASVQPDDSLDDILQTLLRADSLALEDTVAALDVRELSRAVHAISDARRIDLYAVAGSASVAEDLRLRLHRIGRGASTWNDVHTALASSVLLGAGDVAVGISHSGETVEVVEPLTRAGLQGATTVAVTNYPRSPLAEIADVVLVTAARDITFRTGGLSGRHAQLIVLDALYLGVAQRDYTLAEQSFNATADAVAHHRTR
ncbi:MurR/RpiR family transcriptional regulator [Kribbella solani]|uniref:DNA-binding MurR/RpiR family transcriptional regulator n=1 Tax=Kribbella solani TaxID=236067 RepID=A0A841DIF1_9ACTN|nr:MurR/RpiR family transcriptional regulator [Kribbella solani]MBB5976875.1 DNA-binding MurR/RpiR family transcriptional regulator [Kribbella solani]MDX2972936.1 MurR/RpiR family transcriptional regulator [Kribbella solani]MDX3005897.1 MurR/RpiR family transcriptional regulator [Kribbella solani]